MKKKINDLICWWIIATLVPYILTGFWQYSLIASILAIMITWVDLIEH
jgi:hypothetical protein